MGRAGGAIAAPGPQDSHDASAGLCAQDLSTKFRCMGIDPDGNLSPFIETGEEAMRFLVVLIGLSTLFVAAGDPVSRAVADDANTCIRGVGDEQIVACTRAIQSGRWSGQALARVYASRGIAYRAKGDLERAKADYNEVIRLDPKLVGRSGGRLPGT